MLRPLLAGAVLAAVSLPVAASGNMIQPQLYAKVTARAISLRTADGARVTELQQNGYRIVVTDVTRAQNFHLVGPGVNLKTKVVRKTSASWAVYLRPGKYTYSSDNSRLRGSFIVRSEPPPA